MIAVDIKGVKELRHTLANLPKQFIKSAEKSVLRAGAKPIAKQAKQNAPVGTGEHSGLLKKSIGVNVKKMGSTVTARIGPRRGFRISLGKKRTIKDRNAKSRRNGLIPVSKAGDMVERFKDPVNYSHLVEYGTAHSRAQPFLRPAVDAAKPEVLAAMASGLEKYLTRTAARLAKKRAI